MYLRTLKTRVLTILHSLTVMDRMQNADIQAIIHRATIRQEYCGHKTVVQSLLHILAMKKTITYNHTQSVSDG